MSESLKSVLMHYNFPTDLVSGVSERWQCRVVRGITFSCFYHITQIYMNTIHKKILTRTPTLYNTGTSLRKRLRSNDGVRFERRSVHCTFFFKTLTLHKKKKNTLNRSTTPTQKKRSMW